MKYLIVICYGASDRPDNTAGHNTPFKKAHTPTIDKLLSVSFTGMVQNVPTGYQPAQNAAPWSVFGYPVSGNTDRAAAELIGSGLRLRHDDVVFFADFVSLSQDAVFENRRMLSVCNHLTYDQTAYLIQELQQRYKGSCFSFVCNKYGRCFLIWHKGEPEPGRLYPPSSLYKNAIREFLPSGKFAPPLSDIIRQSSLYLRGHPVNRQLSDKELATADAVWLWGASVKPAAKSFHELFGKKAAVITTNNYAKGIAKTIKLPVINAALKSGNMKALAGKSINELSKGQDTVFLYFDNAVSCRSEDDKCRSIELLDNMLNKLLEQAEISSPNYKLLLSSGQSVSVKTGAYGLEAVPFLIYDREKPQAPGFCPDEFLPYEGSRFFPDGEKLLRYFFKD